MVLDNVPTFVGLFTTGGVILDVNRLSLERTGLRREDVIGKEHAETYWWNYAPEVQARIREAFQRSANGETVSGDFRPRIAPNVFIDIFATFAPLRDAGGAIFRILVSAFEITDRKRAEEATERAQARLAEAQRIGKIGDWEWDIATQVITWSPEVFNLFGRDPSLGPPKNYEEIAAMHDAASKVLLKSNVTRAIESGETQDYELVALRPDGERVHVRAMAVPRKDESGKVFGLYGTVQNITARKQAEGKLRQSEERFRSMFTAAATGIAISTPQGRYLQANAAYCRMLGYTEDELRTRDFASLTHREDLALNLEMRDELLAGKRENLVMVERYLKKNGEIVWARASVSATYAAGGEIATLIVIAEDITEQRKAQESLLLFRTLIDQSSDSIEVVDPETLRYLDVNENGRLRLGYSREEFLTLSVFDVDPNINSSITEARAKLLRAERSVSFESYHRCKDGSLFPVEVSLKRVELDKVYVVAVVRDISERKQAVAALAASEQQYRQLVQALPAAVYTCDADGQISLFNDAATKIWGRAPEIGRDVWCGAWRLYASDGSPLPFADCPTAVAIRDGRSICGTEIIVERPDGGRSYVLAQVDPLLDSVGIVVGAVNVLVDLTERRRSDEARRQSGEDLRALARHIEFIREEQAARIARELHDELGQTLTMLKLHVRKLQRQLEHHTGQPTPIESREAVELIHRALRNVRELCAELRPPVLDHLGLGPAIETLAAHFRTHSGVACIVNGAADLPAMEMPVQLTAYRIVQELLTNVARHAEASAVSIALRIESGILEIEVADDGCGISATEVAGTLSLGLLGMRERALAAGGSITVESQSSGGTRGTARLPIEQPGKTS
jgi:PAS domain S-box-containing protein